MLSCTDFQASRGRNAGAGQWMVTALALTHSRKPPPGRSCELAAAGSGGDGSGALLLSATLNLRESLGKGLANCVSYVDKCFAVHENDVQLSISPSRNKFAWDTVRVTYCRVGCGHICVATAKLSSYSLNHVESQVRKMYCLSL